MTFCCQKCKKNCQNCAQQGRVIRPGNVQKKIIFLQGVIQTETQKRVVVKRTPFEACNCELVVLMTNTYNNTRWPLYDDDLISMNADKDFSLEIFLHCCVPNSKERPVRQEYELWSIVDTLPLFESINIGKLRYLINRVVVYQNGQISGMTFGRSFLADWEALCTTIRLDKIRHRSEETMSNIT